ncbi:MAG: hypothetical protein OEM91_00495 [Hyphomicrobiales bacterium]|nr:hypothetical protein [Hyphomicrobiales bacterium]
MEMQPGTTALSRFDMHEGSAGTSATRESGSLPFDLGPQSSGEEMRLLKLAGTLLARSRDMQNRIAAIETASQTCRCAKIVSDSVLDILEKAKVLLFKMKEISDPRGRRVLAGSFNNILAEIDSIVKEGYYDRKNLAMSEDIVITTDDSGSQGFSIAGIDMSSSGLELQPLEGELISNSEIIDRLTKVESAAGDLTAHSYSYDTIAFLLQSRMRFARGMIDILEDGNHQINNSRGGHDAVSQILSEICRTVSQDNDAGGLPKHSAGAEERRSPQAYTKPGASGPGNAAYRHD